MSSSARVGVGSCSKDVRAVNVLRVGRRVRRGGGGAEGNNCGGGARGEEERRHRGLDGWGGVVRAGQVCCVGRRLAIKEPSQVTH